MTAWASAYVAALVKEREARAEQSAALHARCPVVDSLAAQCTADAAPEHEHRYEQADLPGYDPTCY